MNAIESMEPLLVAIEKARADKNPAQRLIVAIAGAPGSGKSTIAETINTRLNQQSTKQSPRSVIVPMDGFHLDNAILQARGQMAVKGAPQTFDVEGFHSLLLRLAEPSASPTGEQGQLFETLYAPVFDRSADLARNGAQAVELHHRIIIVEGNYLLLQQTPWSALKPLFDLSIMLNVPLKTLSERLVQRWLDHGYTAEQAKHKADGNDLPNAELVVAESVQADLHYRSVRQ